MLKGSIDKILSIKSYWKAVVVITAFASLCVLALHNGRPTWLNFEVGKSFLIFILTSLIGSLATYGLASLVYYKELPLITYLSNNTMTILGVHLLLFPLLPQVNHFVGALLVLAMCLPIAWVLNRFVPEWIGNKKQKS